MAPLRNLPKLKMSRLRAIGWSLWDPIGLRSPEPHWVEDQAQAFADEYDVYLTEAAGLLRRGTPDEVVVELLVRVETEQMGLEQRSDAYERANLTVAAMKADEDLWTHPE